MSSVPISHGSVTVSRHGQYQGPEMEAAKSNSATHFIICTCAFPTVTHVNVNPRKKAFYQTEYLETAILMLQQSLSPIKHGF